MTHIYDASKWCWQLWDREEQLFLSFIIISYSFSSHPFFTFKCGKIDHLTQTFPSWTSANFCIHNNSHFFHADTCLHWKLYIYFNTWCPNMKLLIKCKIVNFNGTFFAVFPVNHFCSKSSHYVEEEEDKICC